MARYRGGDGHYADVECAYAELERYLVLSFNNKPATGKEKATKVGGLSHSRQAENYRALFANDNYPQVQVFDRLSLSIACAVLVAFTRDTVNFGKLTAADENNLGQSVPSLSSRGITETFCARAQTRDERFVGGPHCLR